MANDSHPKEHPFTQWIASKNSTFFTIFAMTVAFLAYFSMYAFRKPFSVGSYPGQVSLGFLPPMNYKILLIISQVFGYTLSKFIGIKVISELSAKHRGYALLLMIAVAEGALLLFAVIPSPYNAICLFINGIPLGMVWGIVFGFLEGRKTSELLGAGLSGSYIVASGFVKTAGRTVTQYGVSEAWMPFVTGLIFLPIFLVCVWLLSKLPPPTEEDEALRTKRVPMKAPERKAFFQRFAPGLIVLTILYMFLTAYRDFRDNFAREIWDALGHKGESLIFTTTEIPIAFGVLGVLALLFLIRDNRKAMLTVHIVMLVGCALIGLSTLAFQMKLISSTSWMILIGLGLYLGYVPFGTVLFDRLIAAVGFMGTAGFMIYVTDSFGYLGSVGLMLYKNFGQPNLSWLNLFLKFTYLTSILTSVCFLISLIYFMRVANKKD